MKFYKILGHGVGDPAGLWRWVVAPVKTHLPFPMQKDPIMSNVFLIAFLFLSAASCSSYTERKTIEIKRGALACIKEIGYGPAGTHGGRGWVRLSFEITVDRNKWEPHEEFLNDLASCEASSDPNLEVLKFSNVDHDKGGTFILRLKDGKPETQKITEKYESKDQGEWTNDGHWLLFQEYMTNVVTGERKNIKRLPESPETNFLGVSPDLQTIVYLESGFLELNQNGSEKQWRTWQKNVENGILALWLIDADTGKVEVVQLRRDTYSWLLDRSHPIKDVGANHLWISNQFKWAKDSKDRYRLEYPKQ
jgi:hypothetical protein